MLLQKLLHYQALANTTNWALLILRVGISFFLMYHGFEKLETLLAGNSADFPDPFHVGTRVSHGLSVFAEFFCSAFLMLGLFSRLALIVLICNMLIIIFIIHANDPLSDREHAYLFLIPFISLFLTGPGKFSLDAFFSISHNNKKASK